jgi:hypothetical protein
MKMTRRFGAKKEKIIIKKTPLLPGVISRCHPRYDGTRRGRNGSSCLRPGYAARLRTAASACKKGQDRCLVEGSKLSTQEKQALLKDLRPAMPKEWIEDPDMWLSNMDIEAVMRQYEEAFPSFKFLGVVPIDFSAPQQASDQTISESLNAKDPYDIQKELGGGKKCLAEQYCTVKLAQERARGIRTIGCVFNLDPHDKNGSHWIACCILLDQRAIYYFDSYGLAPPPQISRFMRSFIGQDAGLTLKYNARQFQFGNSECGMYCMYFLICMIHRVPFMKFVRHTVPDKYMLKLRHVLFSQ